MVMVMMIIMTTNLMMTRTRYPKSRKVCLAEPVVSMDALLRVWSHGVSDLTLALVQRLAIAHRVGNGYQILLWGFPACCIGAFGTPCSMAS